MQKTFNKILAKTEPFPSNSKSFHKPNWNQLSEENKVLLNSYYQTLNQASTLHIIVLSEAKNQDLKTSLHFHEWQSMCATRNAQAHEILKSTPSSFIREAIGKDAFQCLEKQALKHESVLQRQNLQSDLVEQAKEQIESLLYRLFPDGPTDRNSKGVRFGSKGSLSVICRGENKGLFYDFEKKEGGGPIQLVQHVLNLSYPEAKEWMRDFLGQPKEVHLPLISRSNSAVKSNQEWSSLKPSPAHPSPSLKELSKVLSQKYQEVARHRYLDEKGDLLFYVLRLVDKEDPTKKNIRPLSYGQWQGAQSPSWSLKNYQVEKRPLYHLDQLAQNPLAKVLIVEGEKTADAAQKFLADQNIVCVT